MARRPSPLMLAARAASVRREGVPDGAAGWKRWFGRSCRIAEPLTARRGTPLTERAANGLGCTPASDFEDSVHSPVPAVIVQQHRGDGWCSQAKLHAACERWRRHATMPYLRSLTSRSYPFRQRLVHTAVSHVRTGFQASIAVASVAACTASTSSTHSVHPPLSQNTDGSTPPRLPPR